MEFLKPIGNCTQSQRAIGYGNLVVLSDNDSNPHESDESICSDSSKEVEIVHSINVEDDYDCGDDGGFGEDDDEDEIIHINHSEVKDDLYGDDGEEGRFSSDGETDLKNEDSRVTKRRKLNGNAHKTDNGENGKDKIFDVEMSWKVETSVKQSVNDRKPGKSLFEFIVSNIWEDDENLENQESNEKEEPLLRKFNYGVETPEPVEKTDEEKMVESLFAELDFALASCAIGASTSNPPLVDTKEGHELTTESHPSTLCCQGKHDFILDEEVGIMCRFCSLVNLEIRYVSPKIDTSSSRRSEKKNLADKRDYSMWDALGSHDASGDSQDFLSHGIGTVWDIIPQFRERMYPHQEEGFEFLWRNIAGGTEINNLKKSLHSEDIGGCVISHAPGTGKTFLTIAFLQTYMEVFKDCRPVIMAPCNMLLAWQKEFEKWSVNIPFHNLNSPELSDKEEEWACKMIPNRSQHKKWKPIIKLLSWSKECSILGVSYETFAKLAGHRAVKYKDNRKECVDEAEEIRRILLEKPSLLVLDEGHIPRNERSKIWKALGNVRTGSRIILSGTPFQNNFDELYNTLYLVRPKFAENFLSKAPNICQRTRNSRASKDARGMWTTFTSSIGEHNEGGVLLDKIRD